MAGTVKGAQKAVKTNKRKYGRNYYQRIGQMSSKNYRHIPDELKKPRGFAYLAATGQTAKLRKISSAAGKIGKRGPSKVEA